MKMLPNKFVVDDRYSPNIIDIKVLDRKKVRRAKLYYLRDRLNPLRNK